MLSKTRIRSKFRTFLLIYAGASGYHNPIHADFNYHRSAELRSRQAALIQIRACYLEMIDNKSCQRLQRPS
jgi:hypothetical protein